MYAFGHIMLALYVLYKLTKDLRETFILTPLTLLPDLDLFLPIQHRGLLYSALIVPLFILSVFILNKILKLNLSIKKIIIVSLLLYILHIFADVVCGTVMIFPGIIIGTKCKLDAVKDAYLDSYSIFYYC